MKHATNNMKVLLLITAQRLLKCKFSFIFVIFKFSLIAYFSELVKTKNVSKNLKKLLTSNQRYFIFKNKDYLISV